MPPHPLILGFGFGNLAMLGWLGAAAAPWIIHLLSRRKFRRVPWAAVEYLLAALKRDARRLRLEQLLLLLVRTALIALIVLAVAEPYASQSTLFLPGGQRTHRVIVIDGSYSMAYRKAGKSRFETAKEWAAEIVGSSEKGDGFTLVLMSSPPRVVIGTPVLDPRSFLRELADLRLPHTHADVPAALAEAETLVRTAQREAPGLTRHEVFFLSDLGQRGWDVGEAGAEKFRQDARRLAEQARVVVIDVGQDQTSNLAITDVRAVGQYALPGQNVTIQATVENFSELARRDQRVDLLFGQRSVRHATVDLEPGKSKTVTFSYRFDSPGDHAVEVRLPGDGLEVDDHRWLTVSVRPALKILCVNGRPAPQRWRDEARYLAVALAPWNDRTEAETRRVDVVPESKLLQLDLDEYDCVFLAGVAQFTANEARVLHAYLTHGGSLVFFLGEETLPDRYNQQLGAAAGPVRVLPARVGSLKPEGAYRLDPLQYEHEITSEFRGHPEAGLLSARLSRYFQLDVPSDSQAVVALASEQGDPIVVTEEIGRGRSILVATSAGLSWSDLSLGAAYLPLVQEILSFAVGGRQKQRNLLVGQPLDDATAAAGTTKFVLRRPDNAGPADGDGREIDLAVQLDGKYATWSYADTTTSGVYTAELDPPVRFSVNVDAGQYNDSSESDLKAFDIEALKRRIWSDVPLESHVEREGSADAPIAQVRRSGTWHGPLLFGVLALLFVEIFLAWRFGYPAS
ncbi:MAG: VWA domain-containing protein [Planctomycetes bacterium]|nr:VWA domain-containing protein [Planctomycetota bacterium]